MSTASLVNWNAQNNRLSQAIVDGDRLGDLLYDLGCKVRSGSIESRFRMPCPVHGGRSDSLQVEVGGYDLPVRWACYSNQCHEQYKPSLLGLVRGILSAQKGEKVSVREAVEFMRGYAGEPRPERKVERREARPEPRLLRIDREAVRSRLIIPSPYFLERGFSSEILDRFDVGYSARMQREVVPLYDEDDLTCIGFEARSNKPRCEGCRKHHRPGDDCKYGQSKWRAMEGFPKDRYLYNYAAAKASDDPFVFLVEGSPDVFRLAEAGYVGVALLGSDATDGQVRKLADLGKEVWIAFDNDEAGRGARDRFYAKLRANRVHFRTNPYHVPASYKDLGEMPPGELAEAIERHYEDTKDRPF